MGKELRADARSRRLARVSEGVLRLWDADTGAVVAEHTLGTGPEWPSVGYAAISPDGTEVAASGQHSITLVTLATGGQREVDCGGLWSGDAVLVWLAEGLRRRSEQAAVLGRRAPDHSRRGGRRDGVREPGGPGRVARRGDAPPRGGAWSRPGRTRSFEDVLAASSGCDGSSPYAPGVGRVAFGPDTVVGVYGDEDAAPGASAPACCSPRTGPPGEFPSRSTPAPGSPSASQRSRASGGSGTWPRHACCCGSSTSARRSPQGGTGGYHHHWSLVGGRLVAVHTADGTNSLVVWDIATGIRTVRCVLPWRVRSLALARDGAIALSGGRRDGRLLHLNAQARPVRSSLRAAVALRARPLSRRHAPRGWRGQLVRRGVGRGLARPAGDVLRPFGQHDPPSRTTGTWRARSATTAGYWLHDPGTQRSRALPGHGGPARWWPSRPTAAGWRRARGAASCAHAGRPHRAARDHVPDAARRRPVVRHVPSGAWQGVGAEAFVGDGYGPAHTESGGPCAVPCAAGGLLRNLHEPPADPPRRGYLGPAAPLEREDAGGAAVFASILRTQEEEILNRIRMAPRRRLRIIRTSIGGTGPSAGTAATSRASATTGTRSGGRRRSGCSTWGAARAACSMPSRVDLPCTLVGVDLDASFAAVAAQALGARATILQADATALPFDDGALNLATNTLMMHHLPPTARHALIAELGRVARSAYIFNLEVTLYGVVGFALLAPLAGLGRDAIHDGILSVRRGATKAEFRALVAPLRCGRCGCSRRRFARCRGAERGGSAASARADVSAMLLASGAPGGAATGSGAGFNRRTESSGGISRDDERGAVGANISTLPSRSVRRRRMPA